MSEKKLLEYGISRSENIKREAEKENVEVSAVARGFTYTMRGDQFPPTRLANDDNPFNEDILKAKTILDFGCGVGRNLPWIYDCTPATYYGIDPNPVMLDNFWVITDERYKDRTVLASDFSELPDGIVFDVVVSVFVFQHLGYRAPDGAMDITDITQKIMQYTKTGTIWFLLEHELEESWLDRWFTENEIEPDVFKLNYRGLPEMTHRGWDAHLVIWKQR
jgi:SAM-dependent methyltransferase